MASPSDLEAESAFLLEVYRRLEEAYDIDRWHWREETPAYDIAVGAILVQHTSWLNVERALANLREARIGSTEALLAIPEDALAGLVRPAGFPLTKARRLKAFAELAASHGSLEALLDLEPHQLRRVLLETHGIGPETADVIALYGARRLVQVHDAYTERVLRRLGRGPERGGYQAWAAWMTERLPPELRLYQRFHAAIVVHCKERCRARPSCRDCPLLDLCPFGQERLGHGG